MRRRERRPPGSPIRVAYLTPSLHPGGAERQMLILAGSLPKDAFEVRFILLSERGALAGEAEAQGARLDILGLDRSACVPFRPRCLLAALRAVRAYRALVRDVDIVDAWLYPSQILAAGAAPFARGPVLIGGRRNLGNLYSTKSWVRRMAARIAARRMTLIVANSQAAASELVAGDGIDPRRVRVIPNAVVPAPAASELERAHIRTAWGWSDAELVIGSVANYKPGKGLTSIVAAADALRGRCPQVRFVLVGEGPLRADLEADIRRLGLGKIVRLHGAEPDARHLYPAFDVYVQASESEGLPNVILEAAAAGLPIVATAVGGTMEVVTDGQDAVLIEPRDPDALAEAIAGLIDAPEERDRLGRAAMARAAAFAPSRLVDATAALYRRLAGPVPAEPSD